MHELEELLAAFVTSCQSPCPNPCHEKQLYFFQQQSPLDYRKKTKNNVISYWRDRVICPLPQCPGRAHRPWWLHCRLPEFLWWSFHSYPHWTAGSGCCDPPSPSQWPCSQTPETEYPNRVRSPKPKTSGDVTVRVCVCWREWFWVVIFCDQLIFDFKKFLDITVWINHLLLRPGSYDFVLWIYFPPTSHGEHSTTKLCE